MGRRSFVAITMLSFGQLATSSALTAQTAETGAQEVVGDGRHLDLSFGGGIFIDYPPQFASSFCNEDRVAGINLGATYRVLSFLGLEGSVLATASVGEQICVLPGLPPVPPGEPFRTLSRPDELKGAGSVSTNFAFLVDPFHAADISPRGRIGWGRFWSKELWGWFYSFGVRYRFGRHALLMDVERWKLTWDVIEETRIRRPSGQLDLLDSHQFEETEKPFQIRVGWEFEIG